MVRWEEACNEQGVGYVVGIFTEVAPTFDQKPTPKANDPVHQPLSLLFGSRLLTTYLSQREPFFLSFQSNSFLSFSPLIIQPHSTYSHPACLSTERQSTSRTRSPIGCTPKSEIRSPSASSPENPSRPPRSCFRKRTKRSERTPWRTRPPRCWRPSRSLAQRRSLRI